MLNVNIICVGKLKEKYWTMAVAEYEKRLKGYCRFKITEVNEERLPDNPSDAEISSTLEKEGQRIIGGSWGLSKQVKDMAVLKLSMSRMTFPHQLARVMLCEQIYRGFQISTGGKYHK